MKARVELVEGLTYTFLSTGRTFKRGEPVELADRKEINRCRSCSRFKVTILDGPTEKKKLHFSRENGMGSLVEPGDLVERFIAERCDYKKAARVPAGELYSAFREWTRVEGEPVLSQRRFGRLLTARGLRRRKFGKKRRWFWFGVSLKANP